MDFDITADWYITDPYPFLRRLREEQPVFWSPHLRAWVITRYEDVRDAYRDPRSFSSVGALTMNRMLAPEVRETLGEHESFLDNFSANVDPPKHTRMRQAISRAFTPRAVARLGETFAAEMDAVLDEAAPRGRADLTDTIAHRPSARLMAHFIGVPRQDEEEVRAGVHTWFQLFLSPQPVERQRVLAGRFLEYLGYVDALVSDRRRRPRDDFASLMAGLIDAGPEGLSHREVVETISALLLGGNDTVPNGITAVVYRLLRERDRWEDVRADPGLIPNAVEESLRIDGAGQGSFRTMARDVELHGVTLPAGAHVLLHAASAAHDPAVFEDPERFDVRRPNARDHMAFGHGIHHCVGAALGRLQLGIALERLTVRLPDLRLAAGQEFSYGKSLLVRALQSLHVEW
ncbi:cytochrome P450 [Spirillospora sp. NBC_01491]|nr:cytochrome P450 [Spirillospora sp. NBC_01491]